MSPPAPTDITATPKPAKALVKQGPSGPVDTFRDLLNKLKPQIQLALPKHLDMDRMIRICMTTVQRSPDLLSCTQESLLGCIFQCVQLGLEPDGLLGHAYLIPFNDRKNNRKICTLIIGYKGLLKLARQSNEISSVSARVVYSHDVFEYEFGLDEKLVHKPVHGGDGEEMVFAYAVFRYKDGGHHFDVMSKAEIEAIRQRSMAAQSGPWVTDYDEMAKKTVLRRASKMAPASTDDLHRAIAMDGRAEAGIPPALELDLPPPSLPGSAPGEQGQRLSLARQPAPAAAAGGQPSADLAKLRGEITLAAGEARVAMADVCKWFGVGNIAELDEDQATDALARIRSMTGEEPGSSG